MLKIQLNSKLKLLLDPSNLLFIEKLSNTSITLLEDYLSVEGDNSFFVQELCESLLKEKTHNNISQEEIKAIYNLNLRYTPLILSGLMGELRPKSRVQMEYINSLNTKDIVFASGPAGTGKTHIAAAFGLNSLLSKKVDRLILSRPAVDAGEKIGFLPGDIKEKLDPYLRPLYDELLTWIQADLLDRYISQHKIEIAPLAYMRGRTFKRSLIILDEAQNTTITQMKMFLTRIGLGSKMIITGDESQVDLKNTRSGLSDAIQRLASIDLIGIVKFDQRSVVRHKLVRDILHAYGDHDLQDN